MGKDGVTILHMGKDGVTILHMGKDRGDNSSYNPKSVLNARKGLRITAKVLIKTVSIVQGFVGWHLSTFIQDSTLPFR